jgi:nicotinate-nucleotide adenylyltransferase
VRIGLYGGSFDPVHLGHLLVAQAAREEAGLDRVVFIPAAQSPFKPGRVLSPAHLRAQMLRLALAGRPFSEVDVQELERGGISYTIDTIRAYQARFPGAQLFYLAGADHVPLLPKWREAAALAASVHFLVVPRPGEAHTPFPHPFHGTFLKGFPVQISASTVRERVGQAKPVDWLVSPPVAQAIRDNGLYLS